MIKQMIHRANDKCEECPANKNRGRRNKLTTYRSQHFNESVTGDLSGWFDRQEKSKKIICYVIDEFSRLSATCFVPDKNPESILKAILKEWISKYGTCEKLLHDLGGDFNGNDLRELLGSMGVRVMTIAAYSPFWNGVVEIYNSKLETIMSKLRDDPEYQRLEGQTLLSPSVHVKNTLINRH